ncbi:coagulation factor IX [Culex quinquefasciatus]|uniref:Coagulation factor IX n=1 Tax=Culex quinquefasciatus TaxID=7176 RepID=B0X1G9_CULQU|nr:coagulation factor IX [Culex quinquefasciatus]|eukprot:XP_001863493.1 coagulation factor IX [Culex quinquefasciatus]
MKLLLLSFLLFYNLEASYETLLKRTVRIVKNSSTNYTAEDVERQGLYGGVTAFPSEFPFLVSLQYYSEQHDKLHHFCSGCLLNDRWVITAARCSIDGMKIFLVAGEFHLEKQDSTEQIISVNRFLKYPDFEKGGGFADLALASPDYPFQLSSQVSPIALAGFERSLKIGDLVALPGWGSISTTSTVLMKVFLPVASCPESTPSKTICILESNDQDYDDLDRSFCSVDLGSPALKIDPSSKEVTLVGLVSMAPRDCLNPTEPLILTDVTGFEPWIAQTTSPRITDWRRFRARSEQNIANVTKLSATLLAVWTLFGLCVIGKGVLS